MSVSIHLTEFWKGFLYASAGQVLLAPFLGAGFEELRRRRKERRKLERRS